MIPLPHDSFALRTDHGLIVFHQPRRAASERLQAALAVVLVLAVLAIPVATALLRAAS